MNQKTLIGLAVAALVAIVIAFAVNRSNQPRSENGGEAPDAYVVPALKDHVNDVDKVVLIGAESKPIATLTRTASGWSIAEKNGFAADTGKLREFLLKLADAKVLEQKTSNKDKYATLGVEDVDGKDAKSVEIELGGLAKPVKLIIGNANQHGGTFVRREGEARKLAGFGQRSRSTGRPRTGFARISPTSRRRASRRSTSRGADGKTVRIAKTAEGDANFKLADIAKGREAGSDYAINGLASTLGGLQVRRRRAREGCAAGRQAAEGALRDVRRARRRCDGVGKGRQGLRAVLGLGRRKSRECACGRRADKVEGRRRDEAGRCEDGDAGRRSRERSRARNSPHSRRKSPNSTRASRTGRSCCRRTSTRHQQVARRSPEAARRQERRQEGTAPTKKPPMPPAKKPLKPGAGMSADRRRPE